MPVPQITTTTQLKFPETQSHHAAAGNADADQTIYVGAHPRPLDVLISVEFFDWLARCSRMKIENVH